MLVMKRSPLTGRLARGAVLLSALLIGGCGGHSHSPRGSVVGVTERDFHIGTTVASLPAGTTTFDVHNEGPDQHELIVARLQGGAPLPTRGDGFTIDEDAIQRDEPGALEPGAPGARRTLTVNLTPGRYILFCNMAGHFMAGMHTTVVVR
jgi:uncharacterized cupredoxin-like copper-binding protein